ncbi:hypothetical protein KC19_8G085200 [Ceratodon purpureus]|uniref:Uncharacterized protein n=1 Tax=Ceratodon purpureus TaxID=3225 RepID=A0A8T0GWR8_CERPU|nr:hypothetical protein KC19_8G085200 [Ceratodon purpureus]
MGRVPYWSFLLQFRSLFLELVLNRSHCTDSLLEPWNMKDSLYPFCLMCLAWSFFVYYTFFHLFTRCGWANSKVCRTRSHSNLKLILDVTSNRVYLLSCVNEIVWV